MTFDVNAGKEGVKSGRRKNRVWMLKFLGNIQQIFHLIVQGFILPKFKFIDLQKCFYHWNIWIFLSLTHGGNFSIYSLTNTKPMVFWQTILPDFHSKIYSKWYRYTQGHSLIIVVESKWGRESEKQQSKNSIWIHIKFGLNQNSDMIA